MFRNLFLDDYTNQLKKDILAYRKSADDFEQRKAADDQEWKRNHDIAYNLRRDADKLWYALMMYYRIVLKRRRFLYQQIHCASTLESLDKQAWEIWTSRKKKKKSKTDNTDTESEQTDLPFPFDMDNFFSPDNI